MNVEIKILKKFAPREFVLVSGLPGIAYIGKLSVDYLIQQLKAELIGELYSKHFPPYVLIREDGLVELLRNELHLLMDDAAGDLMFFSGNSQAFSPEGQYEVADTLLDWAVANGVKKVFSLAAYVTDRTFETPNVYGTATSSETLEEMKKKGVVPLDQGIISGENGLIMGLAKKRDVEAVCLLGETLGYQTPTGQYIIDAKATKAELKLLTSILNLKVDLEPLEKQAKEMDDIIAKMAEVERRIKKEMAESAKKPSYVT
ncbi:MAG: PAC2 family protein [Candidatus Bathyarchaeia archaeon]|nr:PAC2 family protein [Candidatus Bathyarchaeia archaeon]